MVTIKDKLKWEFLTNEVSYAEVYEDLEWVHNRARPESIIRKYAKPGYQVRIDTAYATDGKVLHDMVAVYRRKLDL